MPATMHGAPGSGRRSRRQRAAANEPGGALAGVAAQPHSEPRTVPSRTLVIIPAWNEDEALPETLTELASIRPDLDVLVVSDGSTDRTAAVARAAGASIVELPFNLGIGGALQTGFRYALRNDYDRAVQFDADGQHDPREIAALLAGLDQGADMVVGSRFGEGSVEYRVGPVRRAAMRLLRFSINAMTHQQFSDTSSGFRAFDHSVLVLFAASYPVEFMDSSESLLLACRAGMTVTETPTRIRERRAGTPSTRNFRLVYHYLRLVVTILSHVSPRTTNGANNATMKKEPRT